MGAPLPPVTGVVLAGGDSRRMGRDKVRLLLETVHERLAPHCTAMIVVTRPERCDEVRDFAPAGCEVIGDVVAGRGPLVGIHAALTASTTERIFVAAVDMPWLSPALVSAMIATAAGDVSIPRTAHGWEPAHALYHRRCLPIIERQLTAGPAPVASFFASVEVDVWGEDRWRAFDPDGRSFGNLNTPGDLAAWMSEESG